MCNSIHYFCATLYNGYGLNLNSYLKKNPHTFISIRKLSVYHTCNHTSASTWKQSPYPLIATIVFICIYSFFLVLIGLLYPCLDRHLSISNPDSHKGEWSKVMRCIAVFVGINHASAVSFFHSWCQSYVKNHKWSFRLWISTIIFIFVEPESDVLITCKIRLFFISHSVLLHFLL